MEFLFYIMMSVELGGVCSYCPPSADTLPVIDCTAEPVSFIHEFRGGETSAQWSREVTLPMAGRFVEESHYVTTEDNFPGGRLFANSLNERMERHLMNSLESYRKFEPSITFDELYGQPWQREWTPAERGEIGQGSIGSLQTELLFPDKELWLLTMMWAKNQKPVPGTKFLMRANGKSVVVIAGFEIGPGDKKYLGGITREVHKWLGTDSQSRIEISLLKDQSGKSGPVICSQ
jgi:hypothetical protein